MSITTSDSLANGVKFKCHKCGERVNIVVPDIHRRELCIDCLPPDQQAVFRPAPEPEKK